MNRHYEQELVDNMMILHSLKCRDPPRGFPELIELESNRISLF